jgi:hypothetical protein
MNLDYFYRYFSIFSFAICVVIPSLFLAVIFILRDLAYQFCGFIHRFCTRTTVKDSHRDSEQRIYKTDMNSKSLYLSKPLLQTSISQTRELFKADPFSQSDHLFGIPRRIILSTVGAFSFMVTSVLNRTRVHNAEKLIDLIHNRPPNTPLITVSNHMST